MNNKSDLWEILVPANDNSNHEIPVEKHRKWDTFVRNHTKGLTILKSSKGQWISNSGHLHKDKMIPVRIACSLGTIIIIAKFTKKFYNQKQIMFYQISSNVHFL